MENATTRAVVRHVVVAQVAFHVRVFGFFHFFACQICTKDHQTMHGGNGACFGQRRTTSRRLAARPLRSDEFKVKAPDGDVSSIYGYPKRAKKQPRSRKPMPKPMPVPDLDITDDEADDPTVVDEDDEPIVPVPRSMGLRARRQSKADAAKALEVEANGAQKRRRKGEAAD